MAYTFNSLNPQSVQWWYVGHLGTCEMMFILSLVFKIQVPHFNITTDQRYQGLPHPTGPLFFFWWVWYAYDGLRFDSMHLIWQRWILFLAATKTHEFISESNNYTLEKLTCPLKRYYFNRQYIFQPSIFRGHVSFRECIYLGWLFQECSG